MHGRSGWFKADIGTGKGWAAWVAAAFFCGIATAEIPGIAVNYGEGPSFFILKVLTPGVDDPHSQYVFRGTLWDATADLEGEDGSPDKLTIGGASIHMVGPHGEGTGSFFDWGSLSIDANKLDLGTHSVVVKTGKLAHGDHSDVFSVKLTLHIYEDPGGGFVPPEHFGHQIGDYSILSKGNHTDNPDSITTLQSTVTTVADNPGDPFINALLFYDKQSGALDVDLVAGNVNFANLIGAQILLGPGGPVLLNLPAGMWQAMGQTGMELSAYDLPFPIQFADDLLAGNTFLSLLTQTSPQGQISGRITAVPSPAAAAAGAAGLGLLALRRRRKAQ